jgi:LacI family transcriptional regulator
MFDPGPSRQITPRVSLRNVAEEAGVSVATASRVLSGRGRGSAETSVRVRRAAERLEYAPVTPPLRAARRRTTAVAVVMSHADTVSASASLSAQLHAVAAHPGLQPVPLFLNLTTLEQALLTLSKLRVGGMLCDGAEPVLDLILALPVTFPVVLCNTTPDLPQRMALHPGRTVVAVTTDRAMGTALAVDHLVSLGHTRIALTAHSIGGQKLDGYRQAMERHGLVVTDDLLITPEMWLPSYPENGGREVADAIVSAAVPPTAVICGNDVMALGLMSRLQQRGWHVPGDLSVVGWDGTVVSGYTNPPLTTVAQPFHEIARQCVEILGSWIGAGVPESAGLATVPPLLVVRGSTGPPRRSVAVGLPSGAVPRQRGVMIRRT